MWSTAGGLPLLLDDGDHAYLYGPSLTPVAQVDVSGTVQYLHGDLLGSVRTITDSTGAVVGASTFDAFGSRTARTGTAGSAFGFTGNWTDPDTGLVHLRARDYDPGTGQFLSVDPVVDATRQPYAYTGNSPLARTDPSGLDAASDVRDALEGWEFQAPDLVGCFLEQMAAFGAGALDSLTMGGSSMVLRAVVPGYDEFVAGHEAAFTAGSIAATVIQAVLIVITTAGAGAGLAVGLVVIKSVMKSAIKSGVKAVESTAVRTTQRVAAEAATGKAEAFLYQKLSSTGEHLKYGITKNLATRYTAAEMNGGRLNNLASGTKSDMLALERSLHEWLPIGPEEGQAFYVLKQIANGLRPPPY